MFEAIRMFLFDVDGVLTDGRIVYDANGVETKAFHVRDGSAIKWLPQFGIETGIITGRTSPIVERRAAELGMTVVRQGSSDKHETLEEVCATEGVSADEIAYMGDDLLDLPVLRSVALSFAPADAAPEVRRVAHTITQAAGGHGAGREAVEFLLKARGQWDDLLARFGETKS